MDIVSTQQQNKIHISIESKKHIRRKEPDGVPGCPKNERDGSKIITLDIEGFLHTVLAQPLFVVLAQRLFAEQLDCQRK